MHQFSIEIHYRVLESQQKQLTERSDVMCTRQQLCGTSPEVPPQE